jgi:uncharacterized membrane protein
MSSDLDAFRADSGAVQSDLISAWSRLIAEDRRLLDMISGAAAWPEISMTDDGEGRPEPLLDPTDPRVARTHELGISAFMAPSPLPLPPPELMRAYENTIPGLGMKLVQWTEAQADHRRSIELLILEGVERRKHRGQLSVLIASLLGLSVTGIVALYGNPAAAAVIGIVAVGGPVATVWLARRYYGSRE